MIHPQAQFHRRLVLFRDGARRLGIGDLANGRVRRIGVDPVTDKDTPPYIDKKTLNVNADAIVTGSLKFAGDYYPEGCLYGGTLVPEYHDFLTSVQAADLRAAKSPSKSRRLKRAGRDAP